MKLVHAFTDHNQRRHHHDSLSVAAALTGSARGETLKLLAELSDEQLEEPLVGAPGPTALLAASSGPTRDMFACIGSGSATPESHEKD